jgi:hypothetical protein
VPLQATAAIATCASQECLRPGACPAGAAIGNWNTTAKLCYVADEDGLCAMGAKCDPTGERCALLLLAVARAALTAAAQACAAFWTPASRAASTITASPSSAGKTQRCR